MPNPPATASFPIEPDVYLPDLLRAYPHLRLNLDRYGLKGCGGEWGPAETLEFFSRAHGVPLQDLLTELRQAIAKPPAAAIPAFQPGVGDTIYRLFFKGCIAVVLTAGAVWGALLLLKIGFAGNFTANPIFSVNAHGHAMIFGWVGLMVMGFAYQAFPRFKHTELPHPRWAVASFWLMAAGVTLRAVTEPYHELDDAILYAALSASVLEFAAIGIFVTLMLMTFARAGKKLEFYDGYILAALAFFVLQALWDAALLWITATAPDEKTLLVRVASYQAPLRDLQIHGFATLMILGVSQRYLPAMYGFKAPSERLSKALLFPLLFAVLGEVVFFVLMRRTEHRALFGILLYGCMLLFGGIVTALAVNWRIFKPCADPDRSTKFLQTAYGWLLLSVAMMAAMPLYMRWYAQSHEIAFSHAYYGAVRHAITVGFISFMMLGVAAKIVPTLMGLDVRKLGGLWPTYVLVFTGCSMRVFFQVLTDIPEFQTFAYPLAGISGVLEVSGIAIWSLHLWRVMDGKYAAAPEIPGRGVSETSKVGAILELYPNTLEVFVAHGFELLTSPYFRSTLARNVTIRDAARIKGADLQRLLADLKRCVESQEPVAPHAQADASCAHQGARA